jgi:hypothetical protein
MVNPDWVYQTKIPKKRTCGKEVKSQKSQKKKSVIDQATNALSMMSQVNTSSSTMHRLEERMNMGSSGRLNTAIMPSFSTGND